MRPKREWRSMMRGAILLAAVLVAGCENKPASSSGSGSETSGTPAASGKTPRQVAEDFLKSLTEGKATPAQLTDEFQKQIAAFSSGSVEERLAKFKGVKFVVGEENKFGKSIVLRGRAESPNRTDSFALRMTKMGESYKADWLHRSARIGSGIKPPTDSELAAAQDTVRNFLDLLLGGDPRQALALLDLERKKTISPLPPKTKPKNGLEYEPAFLEQHMRAWASGAGTYTIEGPKLDSANNSAVFSIELIAEGKKIPHTIRAKKDQATGQWMIAAFDS